MRLGVYKKEMNVKGWLASEMLDGVRAYWDGKALYTRLNERINVPSAFISGFPPFKLDGELYTKRQDYANISSIVMATKPDTSWSGWAQISYNVFDVPDAKGGLLDRLSVIRRWLEQNPALKSRIKIIEQVKIKDEDELHHLFKNITARGGEGMVLRDPLAPYTSGVSDKNLKYKAYNDAECEVTSHKSVSNGVIKSFDCKLPNGKMMRIAASFNQSKNAPKIGEIITYTYERIGKGGIPESPKYLRVRKDP
ncbi:ATP-dependent DNA ligase [Campylobacter sp. 19-13652]|nr:ATP-dependent DNA ligase [Campylobacter sp. 19-13652]